LHEVRYSWSASSTGDDQPGLFRSVPWQLLMPRRAVRYKTHSSYVASIISAVSRTFLIEKGPLIVIVAVSSMQQHWQLNVEQACARRHHAHD
jgi:hypothetical protein